MTIDEFLAAIEDKRPPAPPDAVAAFEAAVGQPLPDDYRRFLAACNGGWAGGAVVFEGTTPTGEEADAAVHHVGGLRAEPHLSLTDNRDRYRDHIPDDLVWIMDDPLGNAICLGVGGSCRGRVYFWDHEVGTDEGWDGGEEPDANPQLLAGSFTEFVAGMRPADGA